MDDESWPILTEAWRDTYATLHMWTQVVGKIALATAVPLNHCWGTALQVTPRGLATRPLHHSGRTFAITFDFVDHQLEVCTSDGMFRLLELKPRSVAAFYQALMRLLDEMELTVKIWRMPVEIEDPIPFDEDQIHASYEPHYAHRFWRVLVACEHVFSAARASFIGKCSPVHFFWGSFDLAVTRFSGRPAPSREGPAFMREAYSHEVISHGFWPGSGPVPEPAFYAYAVPPPSGFNAMAVKPAAAFYHQELGEFILPYEAVRRASNPSQTLRDFIDSTYVGAASLAGWDRSTLEESVS